MQSEEEIIPYHSTDLTGKRVLVLAPHPDDETIGCGGSLILHAQAGDTVKVVFLTNGAMGDTSGQYDKDSYVAMRQMESRKACACLGPLDLEFWDYEDRALAGSPGALNQMIDLLEKYQPELIYVPSPLEFHPDHRAAAFLFKDAIGNLTVDFDVAFYEIGQPLCVNRLVDITHVLNRKVEAFDKYESQIAEKPYGDIFISLNRFRSLTLPAGVTHAEGFSLWSADVVKDNDIFSVVCHDVEDLRLRLEKKETIIEAQAKLIQEKEQIINTIQNTIIWRLTKPLRIIRSFQLRH